MEKIVLPKDQYEALKEEYRKRNDYDEMSDEEKRDFDDKLDQVLVAEEEGEEADGTESSDRASMRQALRERGGYEELSDEEKERFDKACDQVLDEAFGDTEPEQEEIEDTDDIGGRGRVLRR